MRCIHIVVQQSPLLYPPPELFYHPKLKLCTQDRVPLSLITVFAFDSSRYSACPFRSALFHLASCPQGAFMLQHVTGLH